VADSDPTVIASQGEQWILLDFVGLTTNTAIKIQLWSPPKPMRFEEREERERNKTDWKSLLFRRDSQGSSRYTYNALSCSGARHVQGRSFTILFLSRSPRSTLSHRRCVKIGARWRTFLR